MSVSALLGSRIAMPPAFPAAASSPRTTRLAPLTFHGGSTGLVIECSSRPQKKGTKHHMKTRPRKTQLWDIKRKPIVYAPLPPLPPEWTIVSADTATETAIATGIGSEVTPQS